MWTKYLSIDKPELTFHLSNRLFTSPWKRRPCSNEQNRSAFLFYLDLESIRFDVGILSYPFKNGGICHFKTCLKRAVLGECPACECFVDHVVHKQRSVLFCSQDGKGYALRHPARRCMRCMPILKQRAFRAMSVQLLFSILAFKWRHPPRKRNLDIKTKWKRSMKKRWLALLAVFEDGYLKRLSK